METPRDKYYMELYRTIKYCNDRNGAPLSNDNIRDVMNRVIIEEEAEAHNVTMDNFSKTPAMTNKKIENKNTILTSEKRNNSGALAEALKGLTINDAGYYESDSANVNDAKGDLASNPKVATHTSDGKKRKLQTLAKDICNKNCWATGPYWSSPQPLTLRLKIGLQLVEGLLMRSRSLQWRKSSRTRRVAARGFSGLLGM